ncbi:MAG: hypothetical protein GX366_01965 [Epulopiscium sp.]|nr:hypothetical protein [Candidatus Epulonipiscium sp.]
MYFSIEEIKKAKQYCYGNYRYFYMNGSYYLEIGTNDFKIIQCIAYDSHQEIRADIRKDPYGINFKKEGKNMKKDVLFDEFMDCLMDIKEEIGKDFKDFSVNDFFDLEENLDETVFSSSKVQEKLRECGAVKELVIDDEFIVIHLVDGSVGEFPLY